VVVNGKVVYTAPILKWTLGRRIHWVVEVCRKSRWDIEKIR
jgi:hypothetical protein